MTDSARVVFVVDDDASIRESLKNLLRTAIEQAGAERGVLVLSRWTEPRIAAQATTGDGGIVVKLHDEAMTPTALPESVIQYVVRTNESVILDDAAAQNPFSADPYIRQQHARSILCLPFLNQGQLIGVLYLENNLTPGVFAPARIAVLKLLASQAAISLENARLYRDLAEREAKIRRLVEAQTPQAEDELRAIIDNAPVFLWSDLPDGYCDFLNQPWLTYFNLSLQEAQGAGWAAVVHPDDAAHHLESWQKSVSTGIPFETEARYRRSDGEYRWFLNRANPLRDKTGRIVKWYGTNIDIENLKRTERRLRQSEAYLGEAQRLSHTGSFGWKPDSGDIVWSDETYCIFEYDRAVKPTIDLIVQRVHPEDRVDFHDVIDRASRGAKHFEHAYRLLLPDKRVKHVHVLAHALQNASGNYEFVGAVMDVTDRKRAEEAVLRSEKELRNVVETIPISVWTALPDGTVDFVSRHWRDHSGLSEENASGAGWQTAVHPDDVDRHLNKWRASLATGAPFENEARRRAADGEYRWFLARAVPLRDEQGNILKWYGITMEIEDRKKAEEKLRRSETHLLDAQRLSRTGSWTHDVSSGTVTISPEIGRMWGIEPEDDATVTDFFFARVHPDDRLSVEQAYREAHGKKADFESEFRIVLPDGTIKNIHSVGHPIVSESGDIVEFVGAAMDITERKQAEQRLIAQHTITQMLATAATLEEVTPKILQTVCEFLLWDLGALWSLDRQASVLRCVEVWHKESVEVPQFEAICRQHTFMPGVGLPGRVWSSHEPAYIPDVVHDTNFPRASIAAREGLHAAFGFPILLGADVLGVIEFFSHEIRQPDQELLDMMATLGSQIGQFIERKRAEEAFRTAQMELAHVTRVATLGEMTASIAHEINQPLGALVNNAGACLGWLDAENLEEARNSVALMMDDAQRASEIITRIRALVKKAPPQKDWLDINQTIREVIGLAQSEVQRNQIALETQLSDDMPLVFADRIQLQQVMLNLMMNAIEAMTQVTTPGELLISSGADGPMGVVVVVRDSGPGLDSKSLERLFEPFYTTKPQGMGMGLAICRSIIEAHSGRLWAATNRDRGASFHFSLPTGEELA